MDIYNIYSSFVYHLTRVDRSCNGDVCPQSHLTTRVQGQNEYVNRECHVGCKNLVLPE